MTIQLGCILVPDISLWSEICGWQMKHVHHHSAWSWHVSQPVKLGSFVFHWQLQWDCYYLFLHLLLGSYGQNIDSTSSTFLFWQVQSVLAIQVSLTPDAYGGMIVLWSGLSSWGATAGRFVNMIVGMTSQGWLKRYHPDWWVCLKYSTSYTKPN